MRTDPSTELTTEERDRINRARSRARTFVMHECQRERQGVPVGASYMPKHGGVVCIDTGVYWERQPLMAKPAKALDVAWQTVLRETAGDERIATRCARIQALRGENWQGNYRG